MLDKIIYEEALGIPDIDVEYMKYLPEHNCLKEVIEIRDMIKDVATSKAISEFQNGEKKVQFINYGETELVYVLKVGDKKYTLLVGQPATPFGVVKREYDNLKLLHKVSPENVIAPMQYFCNKQTQKELYITPYLYQARCISSEEGEAGVFIPEPDYHFEKFSPDEKGIINSCMIAVLVKMFDKKRNLGVASCHIGEGGDFILEKGFEQEAFTYENILKRMKLIAARELVSMELGEYITRIKEEFSKITYYETEEQRDKSIIINHKSRLVMSQEEIENGILLGIQLRERQEKSNVRE